MKIKNMYMFNIHIVYITQTVCLDKLQCNWRLQGSMNNCDVNSFPVVGETIPVYRIICQCYGWNCSAKCCSIT